MVKNCGAKKSDILVHSMLVAAMMMAAQRMRGMEFECHHKKKLGISGMEFQCNVGVGAGNYKERL